MQAFRQIRSRVNKLNLDLKHDFFTQSLTVDGNKILDNAVIAESMNDFFCDIGNKTQLQNTGYT